MKKVFIVGGNNSYERMYVERGWALVDDASKADLVQFCGGEDVSPCLYGEAELDITCSNFKRDIIEIDTFRNALDLGIPMAGICRGGQFLNVMCGGSMWQAVDNHCGEHQVLDLATGQVYDASSTHHQMMIGGTGSRLIAIASPARSTRRVSATISEEGSEMDTEVLHYPAQRALCFQPHPEFAGRSDLADIYFAYIKDLLEV